MVVDDSDAPWGVRLRRWRDEVKCWSQQEFVDQVVRLAFETKEDRGTNLEVRLVSKWENGTVQRPQAVYRRLHRAAWRPRPRSGRTWCVSSTFLIEWESEVVVVVDDHDGVPLGPGESNLGDHAGTLDGRA